MRLVFLFFIINRVQDLLLPGIAPETFCSKNAEIENCKSSLTVFVNRLYSDIKPYPYEYSAFDFCQSKDDETASENLGQVLFGERLRSSPYKINFLQNLESKVLCTKTYSSPKSKKRLKFLLDGIRKQYVHQWFLDDLPFLICTTTTPAHEICDKRIPYGCYVDKNGVRQPSCGQQSEFNHPDSFYIYNHMSLLIKYHNGKDESWGSQLGNHGGRIIRVEIMPMSVENIETLIMHGKPKPLRIPGNAVTSDQTFNITYSYSVIFEEYNNVKWSSRWDYILSSMQYPKVEWFSIINSIVIVIFLTGMIGMILLKTLRRDIARYNQIDAEAINDEYGWKLIHGDVFRPPKGGMLLSVFIGSGAQINLMAIITLFFACLGFLSPASRGSLMTCVMVLYVLFGIVAGYFSSRFYKSFRGLKWKTNIILTSFLCPGIIFLIFFAINLLLWVKKSSAAVPFTTLLAILALWFGVSVPLTFIGAFLGFKKTAISHPVRTNQIPRQIPPSSFITNRLTGIIIGGILPFGAIFIQLFFILNSIWSHHIYYMFGLLFLVYIVMIITVSECGILLTYFQLCAEDYRWWWRSFFTCGSSSIFFFLYCLYYYINTLQITGVGGFIIYYGYTFGLTFLLFLLSGSAGFFACFFFVQKIYSVVKVD